VNRSRRIAEARQRSEALRRSETLRQSDLSELDRLAHSHPFGKPDPFGKPRRVHEPRDGNDPFGESDPFAQSGPFGQSETTIPKGRELTGEELSWFEKERAQWVRARRWQRVVSEAVAQVGLRFNEWLVLVATLELTRAKQDAVSQNEVCRALELTRMQVSIAMGTLAELGLVDRGPDVDGFMWRVFVTKAGEARMADTHPLVFDAAKSAPSRTIKRRKG
jgi:DNA-binding MarR family transcriptional regulator